MMTLSTRNNKRYRICIDFCEPFLPIYQEICPEDSAPWLAVLSAKDYCDGAEYSAMFLSEIKECATECMSRAFRLSRVGRISSNHSLKLFEAAHIARSCYFMLKEATINAVGFNLDQSIHYKFFGSSEKEKEREFMINQHRKIERDRQVEIIKKYGLTWTT